MPAPSSDIESLRAVLGSIIGEPETIEALPSGTTGSSFLIETESGRFVVKRFAPDSGALLGPAEQFELLRALADADIAPRPVAFDRREWLLVTEFLEGAAPLSSEAIRGRQALADVARCLRRLHGVAAEIPVFAPLRYSERYVASAGGLGSLSTRDRERHDELRELASILDGRPIAVCHNDLAAENVLAGDGIRLIDFDYAVKAPPVVDLASLVVMNDLSDDQASTLLDAYFGGERTVSTIEFAGVQRLLRLLAHFWALASGDAGAAIVAQYRIEDD